MPPIVNGINFTRDTGLVVSMSPEASRHQPVHIIVVKNKKKIRIKVYTETDDGNLVFEYPDYSTLSGDEEQDLEDFVERNLPEIEYNWQLICGEVSGNYITGLE